MIFVGLIAGIAIGALAAYVVAVRKAGNSELELRALQNELLHKEELLENRTEHHEREIAAMRADEERLREQMTTISSNVLKQTSQQLTEQLTQQQKLERQRAASELEKRTLEIKTVVTPVTEKLAEVQKTVTELEKERAKTHTELGEQINFLKEGVTNLADQAGGLTAALKKPAGRGSWGEIQLRNVIEMAGMVEHCDFVTQKTVEEEGSRLRPDVVVNMPGGRTVVVDSKVPMEAFLQAQEAADEETREAFLARHAQQVRAHVSILRKKDYQSQFEHSPELVIMFVPSEGIYHSALAQDSTLLEYGLKEKVLIATPTTLIGILQAINYGWNQDRIARSAEEIAKAGKELHKRILTFAEPLQRVGKQLDSAAESYNKAIGSYERMVVPQLRRMEEAGAKSVKEISDSKTVDTTAREIVIDTSLPAIEEELRQVDSDNALPEIELRAENEEAT